MRLNRIILLFFGFIPLIIHAQIVDHQDITLPTPSIGASSANYDVEGSNLANGMASPSINLFTIQFGDISVPITLLHSYNGYKPNELPGVLGLGWTISGGGAVVKNIHGIDDDQINGFPKTVEMFMPQCSTAAQLNDFVSAKLGEPGFEFDHFKRLIAQGDWDGIPDKFVAFGPGLHENFYQYRSELFAPFPHSATKIDRFNLGKEWLVENGNGVKYTYGERNTYMDEAILIDPSIGTNSWQLKKIQSANGDSIKYKYGLVKNEERYQYRDAMRYGTKKGSAIIQQLINALNHSAYTSTLLESIECANYTLTYHYSPFTVDSEINNHIFTHIELSQLDSIRIVDKENKVFKVISFQYKNIEDRNSFLLEEVKIKDKNNKVVENYNFTYNETISYPYVYPSRKMDHWGYANGNSGNLYPKAGAVELQLGGDREANADESQFGLLKTMRLPTGGVIKYEYEKNRIYEYGIEEFDVMVFLSAQGTLNCGEIDLQTRRFHIPFAQEIMVNYNCVIDSGPQPACEGMGITIGPFIDPPYNYKDMNITEDKYLSTKVHILEPGFYLGMVSSDDPDANISASISYKDCVKDQNGDCKEIEKLVVIGGHRLKRITQTFEDGSNMVSNIVYHKSGMLYGKPKYETVTKDIRYIKNNAYSTWPMLEVTGVWTTRGGNSHETLLRDGNPLMYRKVSVEKISNDKVIKSTYDYEFHSKYGELANGSFYADIPGKRGQVLNQYLYLDGDSVPIKKTENAYKNILPENEKAVIAIHQDFRIAGVDSFDTKYKIGSWCPVNDIKNVLDSSIITQDDITTKKAYTYNNNGLLESENYLNSKGENVNMHYVYSDTFPSKPIHIEQKVNGRIISGEKFIFNEFAQPTRISNYYDGIGYIKTKEIVYSTFDNISKPIQQIDYGVGNNQNSITSLTWAYNYSFPVINAQNASHFDLNNAVSNASIGNYSNLDDFLMGVGDFFYENGNFNNANREAYASFVNEVQEALPEALVTLYTYCPLKGVTSQTDPNGKTIYYRYDDFGRLSNIKDNEGNILKSYDYNYAQ